MKTARQNGQKGERKKLSTTKATVVFVWLEYYEQEHLDAILANTGETKSSFCRRAIGVLRDVTNGKF